MLALYVAVAPTTARRQPYMRIRLPLFSSMVAWLIVLAMVQAVLPFAHLVLGHHADHGEITAETAHDPELPDHDDHPPVLPDHDDDDCQTCHMLQATSHWLEPAPLVQIDPVVIPILETGLLPTQLVAARPDISSSSPRGPPMAIRCVVSNQG